jgi:hypothetical protein
MPLVAREPGPRHRYARGVIDGRPAGERWRRAAALPAVGMTAFGAAIAPAAAHITQPRLQQDEQVISRYIAAVGEPADVPYHTPESPYTTRVPTASYGGTASTMGVDSRGSYYAIANISKRVNPQARAGIWTDGQVTRMLGS